MRHLRRVVMMVVMLTLLLAACGKVPTSTTQSGDKAATAPSESAATTIKLLAFPDPTFDALINAFDQKYPNYRVEKVPLQPGPGVNLNDLVKQQLSQGGVDVLMTFNTDLLVKENLLVPLDPFIQKSQFDLKGYGPGIEQLKTDGQLFALPYTIGPQMLVYNRDLFQAAGVPAPKAGWTWDDLRATAAKLTKGDGDNKVWGFSTDGFPENLIGTYVNQKTGEPKMIADEADLRDALKLFTTMILTDKSMPKAQKRDYTNNGGTTMIVDGQEFPQGKSAMALEPLNFLRYRARQAKFNWDMAPMPAVPGGKNLAFGYAGSMAIAASSKHQAAAWEFLRFVAGPEGAVVLAKQGVLPMYQTPDVKKAWFEQQPSPPPGTEALFATTFTIPQRDPAYKPEKVTPDIEKIAARRGAALNAALSGDKPWEDALKDYLAAQEELRKAMQ